MIGTIIGAIIAGLLIFFSPEYHIETGLEMLAWIMVGISGLFLILATLVHVMALSPLQKIEQNLTPRLASLYRHDHYIHGASFILFIFPLISIAFALEINYIKYFNPLLTFAVWTFLLGFGVDVFRYLSDRVTGYLNPFAVIDHLMDQAEIAIKEEEDFELCSWIDALAEIGIKAIDRTIPSLSIQAIESLQMIAGEYLEAAKSITHHTEEEAREESFGHVDKVSYILFYLFQRLELINDRALDYELEPVSSTLVTALGKIAIDAAKYDISMATYPLHYIGKFAANAQEHHVNSVADKASCTLLEVSRIITEEVDLRYLELKEPFFSVTQHLEEIAKTTFKQDKTTNITLLTEPFRDLKMLFESDKLASHPDTPTIVADIDRVINQFDQLELVMRTIPPIELSEEEEQEESKEKVAEETE